MAKDDKRFLETEVTKEAIKDLNLDESKIKTVKRGRGYKTYYYEEVDKDLYLKVKRPEWRHNKNRQRTYQAMEKDGVQEISIEENIENFDLEIDSSVDVEEEAIKILEIEALNEALNNLNTEERKIIQLIFFEEFSERKVSEIIGTTQKTINNRKKRILKKLKSEINSYSKL